MQITEKKTVEQNSYITWNEGAISGVKDMFLLQNSKVIQLKMYLIENGIWPSWHITEYLHLFSLHVNTI